MFNDSLFYGSYLFVIKTDTNYTVEWIKKFKSSGSFQEPIIKIDNNNDLVIVGTYYTHIQYDTLIITEDDEDRHGFVAKLDQKGNLKWLNTIWGKDYYLNITDLEFDASNNIYISGDYISWIYFYTGDILETVLYDGHHGFIAKYNSSGQFSEVFELSSQYLNGILDMEIDKNYNIYTTGWMRGSYFYDSDTLSIFGEDLFIIKFDNNFKVKWAKNVGTKFNDITEAGNAIAFDTAQENLYVTGAFEGEADFGNGTIAADDKNIFLAKYSIDGELQWVTTHGQWSGLATVKEEGKRLYVDNNDFIYMTGDLGVNSTIGDTIISAHGSNVFSIFIAKFYANGELSWANTILQGNRRGKIWALMEDSFNNLFVCGAVGDYAIFGDYELNSESSFMGFAARIKDKEEKNNYETINSETSLTNLYVNSKIFPNPVNNDLFITVASDYRDVKILICDLDGTIVFANENHLDLSNQINLNLDNLKKGIYVISIQNNSWIESYKIIKK